MKRLRAFFATAAMVFTTLSSPGQSPADSTLLRMSLDRIPLYIVENRGVYPDEVAFTVQGLDKTLFFTKGGITFRLTGQEPAWVVKLEFVGANPVTPRGANPQATVFSYFKGPAKNWKTGLRTVSRVVYEDLWPGIDLIYRSTADRLKYELDVKPGADPSMIRFRYRGIETLERTTSGSLAVKTPSGGFEDAPPAAWQEIDGTRVPVEMGYRILGEISGAPGAGNTPGSESASFGFRVGEYDPTRRLTLDPAILLYCGYIGGRDADCGVGVTVDAAGNTYVTGRTTTAESLQFPVKVGPDWTYNLMWDAFVAKVNPAGTALVYCGYIGGSDNDGGRAITVDAAGNAYVTGYTESDEKTFPVAVGPYLAFNGGSDAFVAKVNTVGTWLAYCGYLGGKGDDYTQGIAVDRSGTAYVTGYTNSTEPSFPVTVGPDLTHNQGVDAFVAKVAYRDDLTAAGTPRPGGTITFNLQTVGGRGLPYQLATALGAGPVPIDTRRLDLSPDGLFRGSVSGWWPSVFQSYQGVISATGRAQAAIHIPNVPAFIGLRIYSAFVTLDPTAPSGIRSISETAMFVIAK